ncbi:unnamed protein product [Ectocarpus sp. CCAP 1310/34]|nr:unnamed protein product [Ectocarpus sp. CCAP 1310/34]
MSRERSLNLLLLTPHSSTLCCILNISASGLISMLEEDDDALRTHALKRLHQVVDKHWAEVAAVVPLIEALSEDDAFPARELAAAVASRCFFHLEEYSDALRLALGAGEYFDVSSKTEYVSTMVSKCIDQYTAQRTAAIGGGAPDEAPEEMDPRMEGIVERMFDRCFADGEYTQAMGIALEAHRLDKVEETIEQASDKPTLLKYTFDVCQTLVTSRQTRLKVLAILVAMHRLVPQPDHVAVCKCLQFLGEAAQVAEVLKDLLRGSDESALLAYQIAFDLVESEHQHFVMQVNKHMPQKKATEAVPAAESGEEKKESTEGDAEAAAPAAAAASGMEVDSEVNEPEESEEFLGRMDKLRQVLVDGFGIDLSLNFLYKMNKTDLLLMKNIKGALETRNSVLHNVTVVAHGYMQAGTTVDTFLRDNLDWMGRASNWAKFTATASIGVVHRGHMKESMNLLQPYLPQGGVSALPYSEGGALYALGLIHSNKGSDGNAQVITYLQEALRNAGTNETVQHGACLGLGLAAMATGGADLYEDLKNTLFKDSANAGEAAAYAIGLTMLGKGGTTPESSTALEEMIAYAHETAHEKIIRGLAMGIALTLYSQEEAAEGMIEQLSRDRDPILRYGAMYAIGMAYCGTSNNNAIRRLLHVAVSDVSDDVRLAAVTCLGFVLFRTPEQVPRLVSLLAESFNAHMRFGSCLAIGISCAGTGSREAMDVLEPMMEDVVDFVRQGALIAMAMVLMQQSEARIPKVKAFRAKLTSVISDKHQSTMTKMGAIMASGIMEAGGRNVTITMQSRAGFTKMSSVVGLAVWCQYWYWYPLMHFLPLAFTPTTHIGLNKDFKMPNNYEATCDARPSQFAYPKKLEEKKEEKKERVTTVTLSTTAKAKAREARKEHNKKEDGDAPTADMEIQGDDAGVEEQKGTDGDEKEVGEKPEAPKPKKEPEPTSFKIKNPARVTPSQEPFVHFDMEQRCCSDAYVPVRKTGKPLGIIMLLDRTPDEPEDVALVEAPSTDPDGEEADPPEPFEWTPGGVGKPIPATGS